MEPKPAYVELGNNTLLINHAGYGETPPCPQAKYRVGQVLKYRGRKELCAVAAIVPPGFPPEYALADLRGEPRPFMITPEKRCVSYIVGFDGNPQPFWAVESKLSATDQPDATVEIQKP